MSWHSQRDIAEVVHALQRVHELLQRRFAIGEATDVGCDGGQHMVTGQHQTVFGVIETQVIGRVARCVDGHPRTTCQRDLLGVAKRNVWSGCLREVNPNTYA
jgi:hypothetical protein